MEPSKEAIGAFKKQRIWSCSTDGDGVPRNQVVSVSSIPAGLVDAYAIDFAALNKLCVDIGAELQAAREETKREIAALRAELQAARGRIKELEAGEQEPWDMPDASPTYAELEQQLQAANKRILELERNAAAAANMYSSCLEQF